MIDAKEALALTRASNLLSLIKLRHSNTLAQLEELIRRAANMEAVEVREVFIGHRAKRDIVKYLEHKGYKVTEQTVGNTFTISWAPEVTDPSN